MTQLECVLAKEGLLEPLQKKAAEAHMGLVEYIRYYTELGCYEQFIRVMEQYGDDVPMDNLLSNGLVV